MQRLRNACHLLQKVGPYLLLEILMPGGTLLALFLFVYRQTGDRASRDGAPRITVVIAWAFGKVRDALDRLPLYGVAAVLDTNRERDGLEPLAMAPGC
jgi:hypothetical protein